VEQVAAFSLQLRHGEVVGRPARALDALTKGGGDRRSVGAGVRRARPSGETPAFLGERAVFWIRSRRCGPSRSGGRHAGAPCTHVTRCVSFCGATSTSDARRQPCPIFGAQGESSPHAVGGLRPVSARSASRSVDTWRRPSIRRRRVVTKDCSPLSWSTEGRRRHAMTNVASRFHCPCTSLPNYVVVTTSSAAHPSTRAPEHPSTRAPEHPSTRAPEHERSVSSVSGRSVPNSRHGAGVCPVPAARDRPGSDHRLTDSPFRPDCATVDRGSVGARSPSPRKIVGPDSHVVPGVEVSGDVSCPGDRGRPAPSGAAEGSVSPPASPGRVTGPRTTNSRVRIVPAARLGSA